LSIPTRSRSRSRASEPVLLAVPRRSGLRVSDRGFLRLCRSNPDLRLERTESGELIVMAPAGSDSGLHNAELTRQLGNWNRAAGLGFLFDSSAGFRLPAGATRAPDASWIARDRWLALTPVERRGFAPICPDFVVELMSPSDDRDEVRDKLIEYIRNGARLGWLLAPDDAQAEIYRPGRPVEVLDRPATLSGEDVLPGLVLDLRGILFD